MVYLYIIRSINSPEQTYTGFTTNINQRLADHNTGKSILPPDLGALQVVIEGQLLDIKKI